jgi:hypothetical protein
MVSGDPYYAVTFVLRPQAGKLLSDFLEKHDRERFGVRLGPKTFGVVRVYGSFGAMSSPS